MKRGLRFVRGDKELVERLGRRDLCPCNSGKRFQGMLPWLGPVSTVQNATTIGETECVPGPVSGRGRISVDRSDSERPRILVKEHRASRVVRWNGSARWQHDR